MRRMVVLGVLLVMLAVLIVPTLRNYLQQRDQIESLNESVGQQQTKVDALKRERARWDDPTYVQQQARQRLGFARPGEKAYVIVDNSGKVRQVDGSGVRDDRSQAFRPWYGQVWQSTLSAGRAGQSTKK